MRKVVSKAWALELVNVLRRDRFVFAKFMDAFFESVPGPHQRAFLKYVVEQVGNSRWEGMVDDPYLHRDLIRSILWNYSGRLTLKTEPNIEDFSKLIGKYVRSDAYRDAEKSIFSGPAVGIEELLDEIKE